MQRKKKEPFKQCNNNHNGSTSLLVATQRQTCDRDHQLTRYPVWDDEAGAGSPRLHRRKAGRADLKLAMCPGRNRLRRRVYWRIKSAMWVRMTVNGEWRNFGEVTSPTATIRNGQPIPAQHSSTGSVPLLHGSNLPANLLVHWWPVNPHISA